MKTEFLGIKAGKTAKEKLIQRGFRLEDIQVFAAPASGPKWLILYELDRYLIKEFLSEKKQTVRHFTGSSAGAWRAACYCMNDPINKLDKLYENYIHQTYSDNPFGLEVYNGVRKVIEDSFEDDGLKDLLNPGSRFLHVTTSRANFTIGDNRSFFAKLKFLKPIAANAFGRRFLGKHIERHIFSNAEKPVFFPDGLITRFSKFEESNLMDALHATGSIPFASNPVLMNNAEYWDGGVADYHFGVDFEVEDGIAFIPHFREHISPGWFDKYPPFRKVSPENLVMIYPKKAFFELLPNKRITDIEDFYTYQGKDDERFKIWKTAGDLGKLLVDDFIKIRENENIESIIENL